MSDTVKFPDVIVPLVGEDGNAFAILGRVITAMRRAGCTKEEIDAFKTEATSGDYDHLLATVMETVTEGSADEDDDDDSFNGISDADEEEDIIEDDLDSKEAESVVEEVEDEEDEDDDEDEA